MNMDIIKQTMNTNITKFVIKKPINMNIAEAGYVFTTLKLKTRPTETFVMLLKDTSSYTTSCIGGDTNQRNSTKLWDKLFHKSGFAAIDPNERYILDSDDGAFETGRTVALRKFHEATFNVFSNIEQCMEELIVPGNSRVSWNGTSFQSIISIVHLQMTLASEDVLVRIIWKFKRRALKHNMMIVVPSHQYYQRLIQASTHLNKLFRKHITTYPGYPCLIDDAMGSGVLVNIRILKLDLLLLMSYNMPNTKSYGQQRHVVDYLENILSVTNKQKL